MIQDHLYLVYEAIQNNQEVSKIFLRLFDILQKTDGNPIDMRKRQSLIF